MVSGLNRLSYLKVHATTALDCKIAPGSYISFIYTRLMSGNAHGPEQGFRLNTPGTMRMVNYSTAHEEPYSASTHDPVGIWDPIG